MNANNGAVANPVNVYGIVKRAGGRSQHGTSH
jgi:hypothetical protein